MATPTAGQIEYVRQGLFEFFGHLYQPDDTKPFGPRFFAGVARDLAGRAQVEVLPKYISLIMAQHQQEGK